MELNYQAELLLKFLVGIINAELFKTVHFKCLKSTTNSVCIANLAFQQLEHTSEFHITIAIKCCSP